MNGKGKEQSSSDHSQCEIFLIYVSFDGHTNGWLDKPCNVDARRVWKLEIYAWSLCLALKRKDVLDLFFFFISIHFLFYVFFFWCCPYFLFTNHKKIKWLALISRGQIQTNKRRSPQRLSEEILILFFSFSSFWVMTGGKSIPEGYEDDIVKMLSIQV